MAGLTTRDRAVISTANVLDDFDGTVYTAAEFVCENRIGDAVSPYLRAVMGNALVANSSTWTKFARDVRLVAAGNVPEDIRRRAGI